MNEAELLQLKQALTEEIAEEIRSKVKSLDSRAMNKIKKAGEKNGTFDVVISTEVKDRAGEIVRQSGWDLTNYKNNPIVLWGHDYYSLPIGVCTDTYNTTYRGVPALGARGVFYPADINPLAQQVRTMYEFGVKSGLNVGCTTSVGFIPKEFDPEDGSIITRAELLEFSFVPVPANQGVGPASARSLTFDEAKELKLDVAGLTIKGLTFVQAEKKEEKPTEKAAEMGDDCQMTDGTPGKLGDDGNGSLICIPDVQDKSAEPRASQKKLLKALKDEHARHLGEVESAVDDFRERAVIEDQPDMNDQKAAKANVMREACKDLRDALRDEHITHRANSVKCFKDFDPSEDKAFSKKEHLKALRNQHDDYEAKCMKSIDDFEDYCMKAAKAADMEDKIDTLAEKLADHQRTHAKSVSKVAKAMCKAAFGEEDQADEKTLEILKEYLAAFVPPEMHSAVFTKVGSRITVAYREKLSEAHKQLKAATAIVEQLHGALGNDDGEEGRSEPTEKSEAPVAPKKQRSRPTEDVKAKQELDAHMLAKDILRGITTQAQKGLEHLNKRGR